VNKGFESDQDTIASPGQYSTIGDYQPQTNCPSFEDFASPQRNLELDFFGVEAASMFNQEEEKEEALENLFSQPSSPSHFIDYDQEHNFNMEKDFGMMGNYGFDNELTNLCFALPHQVSRFEEQVGDFGFGTNFDWK